MAMTGIDKNKLREYLRLTTSLQRAMEETTLRVEGSYNIQKYTGYRQFARKYETIFNFISSEIALPSLFDSYRIEEMPGPNFTLPNQQKEIFESVYANLSLLRSYLETMLDTVEDEILSLRDFLQSRLRSAIFRIPNDERAIQETIEQLLIGRGMQKGQDYDREVGRVKIATKEVVPDFIVLKLSLAIEVKLVKTAERAKKVVDEISADIVSYSRTYRQLLFVIYDLGHIRDEVEFCHDLESAQNVSVIVIKHVTTKPRLGSWLKRNGHRLKRPKMTAGKRESSIYTP